MFDESLFTALITILTGVISITLTLTFTFLTKKIENKESNDIKIDVDKIIEKIKESENVIDLMIKNVGELREYYVISKQQANKSFSAALLISILGFVVFIVGIVLSYISENNIIAYTTIAGVIVEVISSLFFVLYKNSLTQLNIYHERLGSTEKYLTAMQLIEKMSDDKKDENYRFLMESILIDNSSIVRNKNDKSNE